MAETLSIAPADLRIDEENPRISTPNAGQQKALSALAHHLGKKLSALAADIVRHGMDPTSLLIVMPLLGSPTRYTVLEGNRRLAALRALENPESVAEAVPQAVLKALRKLSRQYQDNPIETTQCLVVKEPRHCATLDRATPYRSERGRGLDALGIRRINAIQVAQQSRGAFSGP